MTLKPTEENSILNNQLTPLLKQTARNWAQPFSLITCWLTQPVQVMLQYTSNFMVCKLYAWHIFIKNILRYYNMCRCQSTWVYCDCVVDRASSLVTRDSSERICIVVVPPLTMTDNVFILLQFQYPTCQLPLWLLKVV